MMMFVTNVAICTNETSGCNRMDDIGGILMVVLKNVFTGLDVAKFIMFCIIVCHLCCLVFWCWLMIVIII